MKPRASMAATVSTLPTNGAANQPTVSAKATASARTGVMSLNVTSGWGNPTTSRTSAPTRSLSTSSPTRPGVTPGIYAAGAAASSSGSNGGANAADAPSAANVDPSVATTRRLQIGSSRLLRAAMASQASHP